MAPVKPKMNYNTPHLSKGASVPEYNGKLRLYNMRFCPYAHRAVLALNAKNLDYDIINVNLHEKPEWITSKSPLGKVPALEISDGISVYESLIVAQYLDDAFPEKPLLPKDPAKKAFEKILVEVAAPSLYVLIFKLMRMPETITDDHIAAYFKTLDLVQDQLQQRGSKFLGGEEPGYADYMLWPWFERAPTFDDDRIKPDEKQYKVLLEYFKNMQAHPVVEEYAISKEMYNKFNEGYRIGKPTYEILNE